MPQPDEVIMHEIRRKQLAGYGVAIAATLGCLLIRWPLFPLLGYHSELMTFFPAIILSAYLGGFGPGLTATLLGGLAGHYFLVEPRDSFALGDPGIASAFVLYLLAGTVISGLTESLHRAHRRTLADERRRADQSEQRWRNLTEALPQLVWSAESDGVCDYFSTQWTEHTGVPERELLGWRWMETLHPDDREPTRQFWMNSVAGRHPYDVEYRVRRRDGEYRWFKTRGVPIRDNNGAIVKWFGTCTDITDLRQVEEALRESEERFRGTFENAAVGIAHVDCTGRFLRVNERYCTIVGYAHEELMKRTIREITHPDDLSATEPVCWSVLRGELPRREVEQRYVRKDGSLVWVELSAALQPSVAGGPDYSISVIQDISERKKMEAELRRAKEAAEAANRAKDEFLANVSHEIRTPMNAILGMTEIVLDSGLTADQQQCLQTAKSAADNLLVIINDLLDFAKIEAGKLELDVADFSLRAAVGDTLRTLAAPAHKKGLELVCHVEPAVPDDLIGDAGRLRQVLFNLVGNSVKFTDVGEVVITVRMTNDKLTNDERMTNDEARKSHGGGSDPASAVDIRDSSFSRHSSFDIRHSTESFVILHFQVKDTGIGIPPEQQERIFRAFEQEDTSTTRRYGGTGLGLTIASRLVALMGGQITVDSAPDEGSTFAFTARFGIQPRLPEPGAAQPLEFRPTPSHMPGTTPLRILVAEDNEFNVQLLGQLLTRHGHQVRFANNGREALQELQIADCRLQIDQELSATSNPQSAIPYDLLLLDVHMPELDGFQVAQAVRERERMTGSHLAIIALTARSRKEDRERCLAAGMDDFLAKPIQAADLWAAMERLVSGGVVSGEWSERSSPTVHPSPLTTHLLNPRVLLAACGGDAAILERIGETFRALLPDHFKAVQDALRDQDGPRLREAAHKLAGMVAAFSTVAGGTASDLEDHAEQCRLEQARVLVSRLETMVPELMRQTSGVSIEALHAQLRTTAEPGRISVP
jgi:PAS domain S-box-containing protein